MTETETQTDAERVAESEKTLTLLWLDKLITACEDLIEADNAYWEETQCGQDTEQAEASGHLTGQLAGLQAARLVIERNIPGAEAALDLYDRETDERMHPLYKGEPYQAGRQRLAQELAGILDGKQWSPDDLDEIADRLRKEGAEIRDAD